MQTSTDILNELKAISPAVAAIEKRNVFTVPNGYFESLSDAVLMNVQQEESFINTISTPPAMQVPQGYFDSLASNILNKIKEQEEETVLSPLLQSMQGQNVFKVPQGYFESLADTILNKATTAVDAATELKELSPMLYSIQNENVFAVPQGYFESLANNILNKATTQIDAATELRELSPMLYSIQNENVFTVPQAYFESLATTILRKVEPPQAKVVSMKKRTTSTVLKYAIAAVFTGVMALGVYKFANNSNASVALPAYVAEGKKIKNVDAELTTVSNDDIIKYLQSNGDDIDAQTVASNLNTEDLPSQDDYLTDDKALDKYLDKVDLNDLKN